MAPSFDDVSIRRPELAALVLDLLRRQPGRPLAMFAPRRVGKTFFLDHDLGPAATRGRWAAVYADLWLQKDAPLQAINHALEEALDDAMVPKRAAARLAKTPVKKLGLLGASLDLGDTPARRALPSSPELRLDALVARVAAARERPVLLMLDEVQTLADSAGGDRVIAALRAVLHKRRAAVSAVFTGSSQEGLTRMLSTAGAPMYQFAQLMDFPPLGDDYLEALAAHFARVHRGKALHVDALREVFARLGHKPQLMRDIVKSMSAEGLTDIAEGLRRFVADDRQVAGWQALLAPLPPLDRGVLHIVAAGLPPLGQPALEQLSDMLGTRPTLAKVRVALARLRRAGLVRTIARSTVIEDSLLAQHLSSTLALDDGAARPAARRRRMSK